MSSPTACLIEESIVDPINKTLTTYTRNITYQKLMLVEEKCEYKRSLDCKDWYVFVEVLNCNFDLSFIKDYWRGFVLTIE